jgi:hypothetical protein
LSKHFWTVKYTYENLPMFDTLNIVNYYYTKRAVLVTAHLLQDDIYYHTGDSIMFSFTQDIDKVITLLPIKLREQIRSKKFTSFSIFIELDKNTISK